MSQLEELKQIKKLYGERFMKLCRKNFSTILEYEGVLLNTLKATFSNNSKKLCEDICNENMEETFKRYVYKKSGIKLNQDEDIETNKTPYELLDEAGYKLYECETENELQSFKKYYKESEELCSFHGERLDRSFVFFAVKKDVNNIKREDFENPKREDEYGTSVLGIQFTKDQMCTVSILNRYNHTVTNPDATYSNDLNRIIPGLRNSFAKLLQERGYELNNKNVAEFELKNYIQANDGRIYKYNVADWNHYYCPGNIVIKKDDNAEEREIMYIENPERKILIDEYILDLENKEIEKFDNRLYDGFTKEFKDIETIDFFKDNENKGERIILIKKRNSEEPVRIKINKENAIIEYEDKEITEIDSYFLNSNQKLKRINLPNVTKIGDNFLYNNKDLEEMEIPKLTQAGGYFLSNNNKLKKIDFPNLEEVGNLFLEADQNLEDVNLPNIKKVGDEFLFSVENLEDINLPNIKKVGEDFLFSAVKIKKLNFPKLEEIGEYFLNYNRILSELYLPSAEKINISGFLENNTSLRKLVIPKLPEIEEKFQDIIKENLKKQQISSADIAKLDKENNIAESEINKANEEFRRLCICKEEEKEK